MNLSVCMIIKNEERYLEGCLSSLIDIADEIIIVDTGSTDKSLSIAQKFNAKIFYFKWIDDFSAARNYSISMARGKWILWLDADERLDSSSVEELKKIVAGDELSGVTCKVVSINPDNSLFTAKLYRLFRNHKGVKFVGNVHEQIIDSLVNLNYKLSDSGIIINHLGYNVSEEEIKKKALRNLELMKKNWKSDPSWLNAYHMGQTLMQLNNHEDAKEFFLSVTKSNLADITHKSESFRILAAICLNQNQPAEAEKFALEGLKINHGSLTLNYILSFIYEINNDYYNSLLCITTIMDHWNKQIQGFDFSVNIRDILIRGLNLAVIVYEKEEFNNFYTKLLAEGLINKDSYFCEYIFNLFNNLPQGRGLNEKEINFEIFKPGTIISLLEKTVNSKDFLPAFSNYLINININEEMLRRIGELLLKYNLYLDALKIYQKLSEEFNNLSDMMTLISILINLNKLGETLDLIHKIKKNVENDQVSAILSNIQKKIEESI